MTDRQLLYQLIGYINYGVIEDAKDLQVLEVSIKQAKKRNKRNNQV